MLSNVRPTRLDELAVDQHADLAVHGGRAVGSVVAMAVSLVVVRRPTVTRQPCRLPRSASASPANEEKDLQMLGKQRYGLSPVTTYKVGQVADLLGVSTDTVRRWADGGRLRMQRVEGWRAPDRGRRPRAVPDRDRAARATIDGDRVGAQPVPGIVTKVEKEGLVAVVHIQAGPHRVVSLMTA